MFFDLLGFTLFFGFNTFQIFVIFASLHPFRRTCQRYSIFLRVCTLSFKLLKCTVLFLGQEIPQKIIKDGVRLNV